MGKMFNQQSQTGAMNTIMHQQPQQQQQHQPLTSPPTTTIIYLTYNPLTNLLSQYLQKFNCYKRFVQNTIIQLGEDWRIQSGLLAQQIINQRNLSNEQFCIFNQFMSGFVRAKSVQLQQQTPIQCQQQQQQNQFLRYFCHNFEYHGTSVDISQQIKMNISSSNNNNNSTINVSNNYSSLVTTTMGKQTDFSNNLTFKTLSLGFYITAGDVWMKVFKKYHKLEEGIGKIGISQQQNKVNNYKNNLTYFASLIARPINNNSTLQQQWTIQPQEQISTLLSPYQHMFSNDSSDSAQHLRKSIKLGCVVVNIAQTTITNKSESTGQVITTTVRQMTLCRQFYQQLFIVWLVFSIKKSFNSTLFPQSCFVRYCDIIIGSQIFQQKQKDLVNYHSIYNQFKLLCDSEWKRLMKDYMVALNDDREVLRVLVGRIEGVLVQRFKRELEGKKEEIKKMNYSL